MPPHHHGDGYTALLKKDNSGRLPHVQVQVEHSALEDYHPSLDAACMETKALFAEFILTDHAPPCAASLLHRMVKDPRTPLLKRSHTVEGHVTRFFREALPQNSKVELCSEIGRHDGNIPLEKLPKTLALHLLERDDVVVLPSAFCAAHIADEVAAALLRRLGGEGIHFRDEVGRTPLHYACTPSYSRWLGCMKADVTAVDREGTTVLDFEFKRRNNGEYWGMVEWHVVDFLLRRGLDITHKQHGVYLWQELVDVAGTMDVQGCKKCAVPPNLEESLKTAGVAAFGSPGKDEWALCRSVKFRSLVFEVVGEAILDEYLDARAAALQKRGVRLIKNPAAEELHFYVEQLKQDEFLDGSYVEALLDRCTKSDVARQLNFVKNKQDACYLLAWIGAEAQDPSFYLEPDPFGNNILFNALTNENTEVGEFFMQKAPCEALRGEHLRLAIMGGQLRAAEVIAERLDYTRIDSPLVEVALKKHPAVVGILLDRLRYVKGELCLEKLYEYKLRMLDPTFELIVSAARQEHGCRSLLQKPVMTKAIDYLWRKYGLKAFILSFIRYLVFLVLFSYMAVSRSTSRVMLGSLFVSLVWLLGVELSEAFRAGWRVVVKDDGREQAQLQFDMAKWSFQRNNRQNVKDLYEILEQRSPQPAVQQLFPLVRCLLTDNQYEDGWTWEQERDYINHFGDGSATLGTIAYIKALVDQDHLTRLSPETFKVLAERLPRDVKEVKCCSLFGFRLAMLLSTHVELWNKRLSASSYMVPKYFLQPQNIYDLTTYALVGACALSRVVCGDKDDPVLLAVTAVLAWTKMLLLLSGIGSVAILCRMTVSMLRDIGNFMTLFVFVWAGFALSFHFIMRDKDPDFSTIHESAWMVWRMLCQDVDYDRLAIGGVPALMFVFVFNLIGSIMLINMLIAMMASSYEEVYQSAATEALLSRAETLVEYSLDSDVSAIENDRVGMAESDDE